MSRLAPWLIWSRAREWLIVGGMAMIAIAIVFALEPVLGWNT